MNDEKDIVKCLFCEKEFYRPKYPYYENYTEDDYWEPFCPECKSELNEQEKVNEQQELENRRNIKKGYNSERENKLLYIFAGIAFFFVVPFAYQVAVKVMDVSGFFAFFTGTIAFFGIVFIGMKFFDWFLDFFR